MNKAVFLDRDGVINLEIGNYIQQMSDFHIHEHAINHIRTLNDKGYKVVVITNQGGIAKGLYTKSVLDSIHAKMNLEVTQNGGKIDAIYYCPHHPDFSLCLCRKPESLLIEKALARFRIDPSISLFIGDKQRDIDAALGAGVNGVLIEENEDWAYAVDELLQKFPV